MRRTWIGTNWKMNFLLADAEAYVRELTPALRALGPSGPVTFVVPPFTLVREVKRLSAGLPLLVGAQNMRFEESGAFTGEISVSMVKDCGADLVELGHSERRTLFGETDVAVNRKVHAALTHGLVPLVCVGETADEKRLGAAAETVARQVKMALHGVPRDRIQAIPIAYEPVWAIGVGGIPAEPGYVSQVHAVVREAVRDAHGAEAANGIAVVYGGSVDLQNAAAFLGSPGIDGLFVGRAAWKAEGLAALLRLATEAPPRR